MRLLKRKNSRIITKLNRILPENSILIAKKLNENSETQFLDNFLANYDIFELVFECDDKLFHALRVLQITERSHKTDWVFFLHPHPLQLVLWGGGRSASYYKPWHYTSGITLGFDVEFMF